MDSMELERERGITIKSAATYFQWKDSHFNIIDTPGHIDFTIEVERSLKVLDGAVLVICAVGGIQSQTITVDKQMKRYHIPRIIFINKMDRQGAAPMGLSEGFRTRLDLNTAFLQVPIGAGDDFQGVVDLLTLKRIRNTGPCGITIEMTDLDPKDPAEKAALELAMEHRKKLLEALVEADVPESAELEDAFLSEEWPDVALLKKAIRNGVIGRTFTPIMLGSAKNNLAIQPLMDAVVDYLPSPYDKKHSMLRVKDGVKEDIVVSDSKPLLAMIFKLEQVKQGLLSYVRVFQGTLNKAATASLINVATGAKVPIKSIVRCHSEKIEPVDKLLAGDVGGVFGPDVASGSSLADAKDMMYSCEPMHVPDPVVSSVLTLKDVSHGTKLQSGLQRFQKEDPSFKADKDEDENVCIHGMGELHLDIYAERLRREYGVDVITSEPFVAYRETVQGRVEFDHLYKRQTGGRGHFARLIGYIEPIDEEENDGQMFKGLKLEDVSVGSEISNNFVKAAMKYWQDIQKKGPVMEAPIWNVRLVVQGGAQHAVDSSELAFQICAQQIIETYFMQAEPAVLEPFMNVEVAVPTHSLEDAITLLAKRNSEINEVNKGQHFSNIYCTSPLSKMFGFIGQLRGATQGMGEFTMEYLEHRPMMQDAAHEAVQKRKEHKEKRAALMAQSNKSAKK
eukprot:NODE_46_length_3188_cov_47.640331_g17_i3.p1 GENE.NODE_46_length_3188_cov_47.640331_g17_i3~~NODE_46_length_3188_cov_47.640331_g17_i3.p1  ORF type:complete len:690 (+),score=266.96 NODE_46_length_3188_cov_47.640331_g17_i3:41-2071(+)